ncbi:hypothetical protein [Luteimonas vadosa]|uniref:Uncharacterized protein n=1 Tax=Luteimonas vadosa TaxID=1165507 RepID=A0ABP9DV80_9GAMM
MLIGIEYSQLGRRSRVLLLLAGALLLLAATLYWFAPEPPVRYLRVTLLAIVFMGAYWLSFLSDFRGRLKRAQVFVATALGLLPWLLVLLLVLLFPEWLIALLPNAA